MFVQRAGDQAGAGMIDSTVYLGVGALLDSRVITLDVPLLTDEYSPVHALMRRERPTILRTTGVR